MGFSENLFHKISSKIVSVFFGQCVVIFARFYLAILAKFVPLCGQLEAN